MEKYRKYTSIFIVVVILGIFAYDGWVIIVGGKDASVSQVIIDYSYDYPSFTFLIGFIMGHLFWRMPDKPCEVCGFKKGDK